MNLDTRYLGIDLAHPFVAGASPLVDDLGLVRQLEDAGAAAIVMHSLYEEQLTVEQLSTHQAIDRTADSSFEAGSYFPSPADFRLGPDEYLEQLRRIKAAVGVPVFASLNGATPGGWLDYARLMEQAGADALELNLYAIPADLARSAVDIEAEQLEIVRTVVDSVQVPVAVKLSPWYSSLGNFARAVDDAGASGLVLFNRFYQADIDVDELEVRPVLRLSSSMELLPRLTWLAILYGQVRGSLAVTGGVHTAVDAVKAVMAGADLVQIVSAILQHGPEWLANVRSGFAKWLTDHEYESVDQLRGSMSMARCPNPAAFERTQYLKVLRTWEPGRRSI